MDSPSISKSYDAFYFANHSERPYRRDEEWLKFFASIADRIVSEIGPNTTLDAGCAMGFLVEALRDRGVEADGIDISEYAIQNARADVQPHCWVKSVTEPLLRDYNLIVCMEVLEYLSPVEADRAIKNFCKHADDILVSFTAVGHEKPLHQNVRPPEYWVERFARHGFFRDVDFDASFLTQWGVRFRRTREPVARVVADYERHLWQLAKANEGRRTLILDLRNQLVESRQHSPGPLSALDRDRQPAAQELESHSAEADEIASTQRSAEARKIHALERQIERLQKATITASPNPIEVLDDGDWGQTTLSYTFLEGEPVEVHVGSPSGQLFARPDTSGHSTTGEWVIDGMVFFLQDVSEGKPLTEEHTLATVTVGVSRQQALRVKLAEVAAQLQAITNTPGWRLMNFYGRRIKYPLIVPVLRRLRRQQVADTEQVLTLPVDLVTAPEVIESASAQQLVPAPQSPAAQLLVSEVPTLARLEPHQAAVDIVICVHNALEDVKRCLESVIRYSRMPYSLILIDDGSNQETSQYLTEFAKSQAATLLRNGEARGYTFAANQGLRESRADYVALLNSDTVVTANWLDRVIACGESDPLIGLIGPLSNAASWQSVPELFADGDWKTNELPEGWTVGDMGRAVVECSARQFPRLGFLNGFCLVIKRAVIDEIGCFDEDAFGKGYGEENDYCLRAGKHGWQLVVAEDTYVHHLQSRSYSHERRRELSALADAALVAKHGQGIINKGVAVCHGDRVLESMRARIRVMPMRRQLIEEGKVLWEGKRVLIILPVAEACGGGNVVITEATAMRNMGVDVRLLNLNQSRATFEQGYPHNTVPVVYVEDEHSIPALAVDYDAVISTYHASVYWLDPLTTRANCPIRGYYIQDFEPYFFSEGSHNFNQAFNSYTRFPDLVRLTKTEWNRATVKERIGVECTVVGPSVDLDLYRPRTRLVGAWPARPLRIAAMIRPNTPRRNAKQTMDVLRALYQKHGEAIEIILFGCESSDPEFLALPQDFVWRNAGMLSRSQVASLLNDVDIFADFSEFQAMGLSALEAMACGAAVIVPENGGALSFAADHENALVVDTSSPQLCLESLNQLAIDEKLRLRLQRQALNDACDYYPEKAAYNILAALFT